MKQALLNLSQDAPELTTDQVTKAYQEFPAKEMTDAMLILRMKAALKWNNVLLSAAAKAGILKAQCLGQMEENESLYL